MYESTQVSNISQSRVNILYNALWEVAVPKGGNSTIHYSKKWLVSNIKLCYPSVSLGVESTTVVKTSDDHAIYEIRNIIIEVANLADIIKKLQVVLEVGRKPF